MKRQYRVLHPTVLCVIYWCMFRGCFLHALQVYIYVILGLTSVESSVSGVSGPSLS